jgi:cytochrome oxidase Cu insertion factor (SCO1/SenC/PrrC family)
LTSDPRAADRRRLAPLLAAALGGLVLLAAITALAPDDERAASDKGSYRGSKPPGRILLPAFELPSYRGGLVSADALRGRVVLLTLLDSQCTDACPILASVIARTIERLRPAERADVRAVAVTADPVEDTPASVRRFLRAQRAVGRLDYLVGTERELRPLWSALHLLPSLDTGQDNVHSAPLRIYSRDGVWVATLHAGVDLSEANLLHDIRYALGAPSDSSR